MSSALWDDYDEWYYELLRRKPKRAETTSQEREIIDELLKAPPLGEVAPRLEEDPLRRYLDSKLETWGRAMRQLEDEIRVRGEIHHQSVEQLDYQIANAAHSLEEFRNWGVGYNRGVDQKRIHLERELDALRQEKRAVRLRFWADIAKLRADLRAVSREYQAALRRATFRPGD